MTFSVRIRDVKRQAYRRLIPKYTVDKFSVLMRMRLKTHRRRTRHPEVGPVD
jgi:hypothetical protein